MKTFCCPSPVLTVSSCYYWGVVLVFMPCSCHIRPTVITSFSNLKIEFVSASKLELESGKLRFFRKSDDFDNLTYII